MSNGVPGVLTDLVSTNGLTSDASNAANADQLVVLTTNTDGSLIYYYYWLQTGIGWTNVPTEVLMPSGTNALVNSPAPSTFRIARGLGFWLKRAPNTYANASTVFLKGQVSTGKQATLVTPGLNLIGFASPTNAVSLNESGIDWTAAGAYVNTNGNTKYSDKIVVVGANGALNSYWYFTKPAGAKYDAYAPLDGKWVVPTTGGLQLAVATNVFISAGQGFWYVSRGTTNFVFQPRL